MELDRIRLQALEYLWFVLKKEISADEAALCWRETNGSWKPILVTGKKIKKWLLNYPAKINEMILGEQTYRDYDNSLGHFLVYPVNGICRQAIMLFYRQRECFNDFELEIINLLAQPIACFLSRLSETFIFSHSDFSEDPFLKELIIGESEVIKKLRRTISQIKLSDAPVLIVGESGTGKELVARAIHQISPRSQAPFVVINCGAIPEHLLESELFGHVRGAFTGALRDKPGLVEEAHGGTLFLDEIGDLAFPLQAKILRLIQEKEFRRVGETRIRYSDVRFLSATNRQLEKEIKAGRFREDLYYRLKIITLEIPPLRERKEDLLLLANHFLKMFNSKAGKPRPFISPEAMERLLEYDWPGNIRELQNEIQRALILCGPEGVIEEKDLSPKFFEGQGDRVYRGDNFFDARAEFERRFLRMALARYNYNRTRTADNLGLSRQGLTKLLKKHSLIQGRNLDKRKFETNLLTTVDEK